MSTHGYTDAHFASTLLECGPHVIHDCVAYDRQGECPINTRYKEAVYSHFFTLFPEMVEATNPDTRMGRMHEWTAFWQEYMAWVET